MRYVVLKSNISLLEKKSRLDYIQKVTNMYYIPYDIQGGIEYISIPPSMNDCLLIIGHNKDVKSYMLRNIIPEKNVVIVSCKFDIKKKIKSIKNIYVTYDEYGKTDYYDGKEWNLFFDISKEELKLINSNGDFLERIKKYFRRIV